MANKEIHYMSKNGTMFWPATTTTAIIDPTSQEILSDILNKKVSVGDAGNIASTVLPPIILESIATVSTNLTINATLIGKTYFCPDLEKIRHFYALEVNQSFQTTPEDTDPSPEITYYDKETDKFYRWDSTNLIMVEIASSGGNSSEGGIQEITWSALKTLRDGGNLTPGQLYRITDYTCTTTQTNTQSAGHVFDVIVLALSESTLSETAWADHHEGDTYFSNCKLEAWELKYCLDNNTDRFTWADTTNGKGVIYWMKDEWNNECPYDFKNIQYTNVSFDTSEALYTFSNSVSGYLDHSISGVVYNNYIESFNTNISQHLNNFVLIIRKGTIICNNNIEKDCINSYIYSHIDPITDNKFNKCQDLQISSLAFSYNNFERVFGMSSSTNTSKYGITKSSIKDCTNLELDRSGNTTTLFNHIIIEKNNKLTILASIEIVKNIIITEGINESTVTVKTIDLSNTVNNPLTIYKPANSVEISV